jgi:hypothetical protein
MLPIMPGYSGGKTPPGRLKRTAVMITKPFITNRLASSPRSWGMG